MRNGIKTLIIKLHCFSSHTPLHSVLVSQNMMMECRASFTFLSLVKSGAIDLEALTVFAPPSWSAIAALDRVGRKYRWPVLFGGYTTLPE
jgi:hypothetical protein